MQSVHLHYMKKFYITTPIYYVNSKPHIGHAYTTVIADILARYYRLKLGEDKTYFLTGTDEHGAKIAQKAEEAGKTPLDFATEVAEEFKFVWKELNISNNDFIRTTEERHEKIVKELLLKLKDAKTPKGNDAIYSGKYEGLYCVGCEAYKNPEDLVNGKCPEHNKEPELLSENNWFFRLTDFSEILHNKIEKDEIKILPAERKKEILSFIEHGLQDIAISREKIKWGIKVPFDDKQVIYVWVDALINYISALGFPDGEKYKKFWPADLHLLGKDIAKFHCIIWPAMLIALNIETPKELFVHGYFTIDGQKMSKTLGNVIDPLDLVKEYGVDATRYLLVSQFPFGEDGDIKVEEFKVKFNSDLANGLGNLVSRVCGMLEKYCDNVIPKKKYNANFDFKKLQKRIDENYSEYKIFENLKEIWEAIRWCDNYVAENKPWELAKAGKNDEIEQILYNLLEIIRNIVILLSPVLPDTCDKILKFLKVDINSDKLIAGEKIDSAEPLFLRK